MAPFGSENALQIVLRYPELSAFTADTCRIPINFYAYRWRVIAILLKEYVLFFAGRMDLSGTTELLCTYVGAYDTLLEVVGI